MRTLSPAFGASYGIEQVCLAFSLY